MTLSGATSKWRQRLLRSAVVMQALVMFVVILHPFSARRGDGRLYVSFLDVGQGDSALVTFPDGTKMLIDGGGKPNFRAPIAVPDDSDFEPDSRPIGDAVVSEYLWHRGLDTVDYVLATHADADHIDGLNNVVENFSVRAALLGRRPASDPEFVKFFRTVNSQNVPTQLIGIGDTLECGKVTATILWPVATFDDQAPSANNDSVVLRLSFGQRAFVFTGDIERPGELAILKSAQALRADVIKVAHHGSRTSSIAEFVAAVKPQIAVISVGQTSIFGHPHKEVVERWLENGATVLTTGKCGTITISTDGSDLLVDTFVPCSSFGASFRKK